MGSGGWRTSNRKITLPRDWHKIRKRILIRDHYKCTWVFDDGEVCGNHANQVDHIKDPFDHRDSNLRSLCEYHHAIKSSAEGSKAYWSRVEASRKKFRADEVHPAYRRARRG